VDGLAVLGQLRLLRERLVAVLAPEVQSYECICIAVFALTRHNYVLIFFKRYFGTFYSRPGQFSAKNMSSFINFFLPNTQL
jgi:hypothetical protein